MKVISFALTTDQFLDRTKTVTRRCGRTWRTVKPGTLLKVVRKAQGLKKGEKQEVLGIIRVVAVDYLPLDFIRQGDVIREGFPNMTPQEFVDMFCKHMKCRPFDYVTRIEFEYVDEETTS